MCNGTDDAAAIQAAFNQAGDIQVSGNCVISTHLIYYSNSTIDLTQAKITYNQSTADWLLVNAGGMSTNTTPSGQGAQRSFLDAVLTSGSTLINSATANFTAADLNQSIDCLTAAGAGANLDFHTRISQINSPTSVTVDEPAGVSLDQATCYLFVRDHDVTITGGTLIVKGTLIPATSYPMVKAKSINNVVIQDMNLQEPGGTGMYHLVFQDAFSFSATNINVQSTHFLQDGIDVIGPARNGALTNVSGYSGDDFIALTTSYVGQLIDSSTYGTVSDISLRKINGASIEDCNGVRVFLRAPGNIHNIIIDDLHGDTGIVNTGGHLTTLQGFNYGVNIDYVPTDPGTPGKVSTIDAGNISGWFQHSVVFLDAPTIEHPSFTNIFDANPECRPSSYLVQVGNTATVTNLEIENSFFNRTTCAAVLGVERGGKVIPRPHLKPDEQEERDVEPAEEMPGRPLDSNGAR